MYRFILLFYFYIFLFTGNRNLVCAQSFSAKESLDSQIDSLMLQYRIPGLQVAIVKDEKIVYRQSYGWSDIESETTVSDSSLFRIASISKPVTFVAILKLLETNRLTTDQLVFGEKGILSEDYTIPDDERVKRITVKHLLNHQSGWTNIPSDYIFMNPYLTMPQVIQKVLSTYPPSCDPGTQYSYSNFGYGILGIITEKLTGMSYEEYVRKEILLPCGIAGMVITNDTYEERHFNEVSYYSQESASPYLLPANRLGSCGGWIASATDLVKLLVHIDRNPEVEDIIPETMMQGTYFNFLRWEHSGSLPGTTTLLVRKDNRWGYAVLANTRTLPTVNIINGMRHVLDSVTNE